MCSGGLAFILSVGCLSRAQQFLSNGVVGIHDDDAPVFGALTLHKLAVGIPVLSPDKGIRFKTRSDGRQLVFRNTEGTDQQILYRNCPAVGQVYPGLLISVGSRSPGQQNGMDGQG